MTPFLAKVEEEPRKRLLKKKMLRKKEKMMKKTNLKRRRRSLKKLKNIKPLLSRNISVNIPLMMAFKTKIGRRSLNQASFPLKEQRRRLKPSTI